MVVSGLSAPGRDRHPEAGGEDADTLASGAAEGGHAVSCSRYPHNKHCANTNTKSVQFNFREGDSDWSLEELQKEDRSLL